MRGPPHALFREDMAQARNHRHPLAEELVGEAALAVLVLRGFLGVVLLDVVLAIPEELVALLGPLLVEAAIFIG